MEQLKTGLRALTIKQQVQADKDSIAELKYTIETVKKALPFLIPNDPRVVELKILYKQLKKDQAKFKELEDEFNALIDKANKLLVDRKRLEKTYQSNKCDSKYDIGSSIDPVKGRQKLIIDDPNLSKNAQAENEKPKLAVSRNGTVYALWEKFSNNQILFSRSTDGGASFSNPINITHQGDSPEIAVAGNNNVFVVCNNRNFTLGLFKSTRWRG